MRPALAAFGTAATRDAVRFGVVHGWWCAASCWAVMMFVAVFPSGSIAAMAAATLLITCERLDRPTAPRWAWRGFGTAGRFAVGVAMRVVQTA